RRKDAFCAASTLRGKMRDWTQDPAQASPTRQMDAWSRKDKKGLRTSPESFPHAKGRTHCATAKSYPVDRLSPVRMYSPTARSVSDVATQSRQSCISCRRRQALSGDSRRQEAVLALLHVIEGDSIFQMPTFSGWNATAFFSAPPEAWMTPPVI